MRGEGGVAGEGRVVGVPKFHSWDKRTMPLTNINSNWMSNASILSYAGLPGRLANGQLDYSVEN